MTTAFDSITIHESDLGWALGCSRMGASHQRRAIPNQDAVAIESDTLKGLPYLAMAVADGHGDKRHDLSHHGAVLAVQAAIGEMRSFYQNFGMQGSSLLLKRTFQADFPRRVGSRWREAVLEDALLRGGEGEKGRGGEGGIGMGEGERGRGANDTRTEKGESRLVAPSPIPIQRSRARPYHALRVLAEGGEGESRLVAQESPSPLAEGGDYGEQQAIPSCVRTCLTRYGTTLLVLLITSESILLGQIGDGDILLLREGGQIEEPFERHDGLLATETYSLALPDAHQFWQTAVRERAEGGMVLMATDGLVNAMTEGHLKTFASSLLARIQEFGVEAVAALLPDWLDHFSQQGSGDDITLALATTSLPHPFRG